MKRFLRITGIFLLSFITLDSYCQGEFRNVCLSISGNSKCNINDWCYQEFKHQHKFKDSSNFKNVYFSISSGVKYIFAGEFNNRIENWHYQNGFSPLLHSKDALNWGITSDLSLIFPLFKFMDLSVDFNHSYWVKKYLDESTERLRIDINQYTPSFNAYFRIGPLRIGGGGFVSVFRCKWNDNILNNISTLKNTRFGYSISLILITPVKQRFCFITKARYDSVKFKLDEEKNSFSGLTFNIGISIKLKSDKN